MRAEDFLNPPAREVRPVALPRRGGQAHVRALYAGEAVALSKALQTLADAPEETIAVQLAAFVCDERGEALFTLEQARAAVAKIYPDDVRALMSAGTEVNSVSDAATESARKNS